MQDHYDRHGSGFSSADDSMPNDEAFEKIYNINFPEDVEVDNDYRFDISPQSLADENCYVFAVKNTDQVRIMAAQLCYNKEKSRHDLRNMRISETFITINELDEIILHLDIY